MDTTNAKLNKNLLKLRCHLLGINSHSVKVITDLFTDILCFL